MNTNDTTPTQRKKEAREALSDIVEVLTTNAPDFDRKLDAYARACIDADAAAYAAAARKKALKDLCEIVRRHYPRPPVLA